MKSRGKYVTFIVIALLCLGIGTLAVYSFRPAKSEYIRVTGVERIRDYKKWQRVNQGTLSLAPNIAELCAVAPELAAHPIAGHDGKYYAVFVNEAGRKAMSTTEKPAFPIGSIIVKEKLPSKNSTSPELLTVMVKREQDYDSANGDWEYLVLNGTATKVEARENLQHCQSCHAVKKDTDYVFRTYLPERVSNKLR